MMKIKNLNEEKDSKIVEKAIEYNNKQKVGDPLKNYSGSLISRHKPAGKSIGGKIYAHMDYLNQIIKDESKIEKAIELLEDARLYKEAFSYNCFCWNPKENIILFQEGPDFDSAPEPKVGYIIKVNLDTNNVEKSKKPYEQIWHHKWLWVDNNYDGFDVADSWNRSKYYATKVLESPNGSNIKNWNNQLRRYGLENLINEI